MTDDPTSDPQSFRVAAGWTIRADNHESAVIRLFEHQGVPVLIAEAGRYPSAVHEDGRDTGKDPHVLISLGGTASRAPGGPFVKTWTGAGVYAEGRYVCGRRRMLSVAQAELPKENQDRSLLVAAALEHLDAAVAAVATIDAVYEAYEARVARGWAFRQPFETREAYEAACTSLGVETLTDQACIGYSVRYGDFAFPHYTADRIVQMHLANLRMRALDAAKEAATKVAQAAYRAQAALADAPRRAWGASGVRYDERCSGCRRVTEIDNSTERCRKCSP